MAPEGDHLGAFAVTAGIGADELAANYAAEHDDYSAPMLGDDFSGPDWKKSWDEVWSNRTTVRLTITPPSPDQVSKE